MPLSQLHYHFGSKSGLILELLATENQQRLARQHRMYAEAQPLWQRYEQACDFLEDDLESGYVRVLQEMIAAGWSNQEIGDAVRELVSGWFVLLTEVAQEAEKRHGPLGPITRRGAGHAGRQRVHRLGGDAAAGLREPRHADPVGPATGRGADPPAGGSIGSERRRPRMRACEPNDDGLVERDGREDPLGGVR